VTSIGSIKEAEKTALEPDGFKSAFSPDRRLQETCGYVPGPTASEPDDFMDIELPNVRQVSDAFTEALQGENYPRLTSPTQQAKAAARERAPVRQVSPGRQVSPERTAPDSRHMSHGNELKVTVNDGLHGAPMSTIDSEPFFDSEKVPEKVPALQDPRQQSATREGPILTGLLVRQDPRQQSLNSSAPTLAGSLGQDPRQGSLNSSAPSLAGLLGREDPLHPSFKSQPLVLGRQDPPAVVCREGLHALRKEPVKPDEEAHPTVPAAERSTASSVGMGQACEATAILSSGSSALSSESSIGRPGVMPFGAAMRKRQEPSPRGCGTPHDANTPSKRPSLMQAV